MVITEAELREMWRDGRNPLPAFPPGTRFSPSAQDFIKDHQLEIRFADPTPESIPVSRLPRVATNYQLPASLDSLHALTLLTAAEARRYQLPLLARRLDALAAYCVELRTAESQGREPAPLAGASAGSAPDFAPGPADHAIVHWLNLLRASARQAAHASGSGSAGVEAGLVQMSNAAAELGQRVQSGELGWNATGDYSGSR